MTPSELKANILHADPESHFFDRDTMRFFGDTMSNFGVRDAGEILSNYDAEGNYVKTGVTVACWELYRKRAVKHGLKSSHYFCKATFAEISPRKD